MRKLLFLMSIAVFSANAKEDDTVVDIPEADYRNHDINLINKHGWLYKNQADFDAYLARYYTYVSERLNKDQAGEVGYVTENSTNVGGYQYDIDITAPEDHILSTYPHIRPAIARKWSDDNE